MDLTNIMIHKLAKNAPKSFLKAEDEEAQMANVVWNVKQVRLGIEPEQFLWPQRKLYGVQMAPTSATKEYLTRVKLITSWFRAEPIPFFNFVSSMKIVFWNFGGP